jgi:hypothetical protein
MKDKKQSPITIEELIIPIVGYMGAHIYCRFRWYMKMNEQKKNYKRNRNGKWWCWDSSVSISSDYTYMSGRQVRYALKKLKEHQLVVENRGKNCSLFHAVPVVDWVNSENFKSLDSEKKQIVLELILRRNVNINYDDRNVVTSDISVERVDKTVTGNDISVAGSDKNVVSYNTSNNTSNPYLESNLINSNSRTHTQECDACYISEEESQYEVSVSSLAFASKVLSRVRDYFNIQSTKTGESRVVGNFTIANFCSEELPLWARMVFMVKARLDLSYVSEFEVILTHALRQMEDNIHLFLTAESVLDTSDAIERYIPDFQFKRRLADREFIKLEKKFKHATKVKNA